MIAQPIHVMRITFLLVGVILSALSIKADGDEGQPSVDVTQTYLQKQLENNFLLKDDQDTWIIEHVEFDAQGTIKIKIKLKDIALAYGIVLSKVDSSNISSSAGYVTIYSPEKYIVRALIVGSKKTGDRLNKLVFVTWINSDPSGNAPLLVKAFRREASLFGAPDSGDGDPFKP